MPAGLSAGGRRAGWEAARWAGSGPLGRVGPGRWNGFYSEGSRELCRGAHAAGEGALAAACLGGRAAGRPNG